jgi:hypothetical protein
MGYITKDSGKREEFSTGMVRDTQDDKLRYDLLVGLNQKDTLLDHWALVMTNGSKKYTARNWEKACTQEEYDRFKASAWRHFIQFMRGDMDEAHAGAVCFNLNGMLYVKERLREKDEFTKTNNEGSNLGSIRSDNDISTDKEFDHKWDIYFRENNNVFNI